jgi:RNase P subunit RPR2
VVTVSRQNATHEMARCRNCGCDLVVKASKTESGWESDGHVYCTNEQCGWSTVRYPIGSTPETGSRIT